MAKANNRYPGSFPTGGAPASPVEASQPVQSYVSADSAYAQDARGYAPSGQFYAQDERAPRKKINGWKVFDILVIAALLIGFLVYAVFNWGVPWWNEQIGIQNVTTVKLTKADIETAMQNGEPVALAMDALEATNDVATAPAFKIKSKEDRPVKVKIPVTNPMAGTVVMLIEPGKPARIVPTSVMTEGGIVATIPVGTIAKIVDNSEVFVDVPETAWFYETVTFAAARDLFSGSSDGFFSPEDSTTRAMLMVALARLDGVEATGGSMWYEGAMAWAIERGVCDGSNPNGEVTREQLATMLWRYMGAPANNNVLAGYTDTAQISDYAQDAMRWAVSNGLMSGFDDGRLAPQGQASRAQVAKILENLILNLM